MIYKDVIDILKDTLSRFKGVNFVRYSGDDLNNQQHNHKPIQCYIDDISFHQFNLTQNIVKAEYQIYILGVPEHDTPDDILDVQDTCYNIAINMLAYIDNFGDFNGMLSLHDYSILSLSHYTAQNNAGVKLSVTVTIPNGVDMCSVEDYIGKPYTPEEDKEIDIDTKETGNIDVKPITLRPTRRC